MIKGGKFSVYEGVMFISLLVLSKILYTGTTAVAGQIGTAAWYGTLISCVTGILLFILVYMLLERFPGKNLIEIYKQVLGKTAGLILGLPFSAFLLYYSAVSLREFIDMIKVYTLPDTPMSIILITFILVLLLLSYKGIETIIRVSCINFYPILLGLIVVLALAYPYYDLDYIKPYFGYGMKKTLTTGMWRASAYQEVLTLPLIVSSVHRIKDIKKIGVISLAISGVMFSISLLCYLMAFQYTGGRENLSGLFQLSRIIYYSRFFQRIESVFLFSWVNSSLITVSTAFYLANRVYCQCFEIEDHRPILIPFGLLLYAASFIPKNVSELISIHLIFIRQYSGIFAFGMPILVLIISVVLGKKGEKSA